MTLHHVRIVHSVGVIVATAVALMACNDGGPTGVPTGNLVRGLYIEDLASAW